MPSIVSAIETLDENLPYGEVLYPGEVSYERAVFIGNLLYRLTTPFAVILPRNIAEVQEIVKYCYDNKIRLTVKNGGHSYAGYCLNDEGIVLDMSAMREVHINDNSTLVKIQGGATWVDAYATLVGKDAANIIIGGQCPFVGVSGFTLGGGLSPFSRSYGLGVDNVVEMTMVTATGDLVTVTDHEMEQHKRDLFWALRGGGGGNFGILVDFTSKVHKLRNADGHIVAGNLTWKLPSQEQDFKDMMKTWNDAPQWPPELAADMITRFVDGEMVGQMTILFNGTMEECLKEVAPLMKYNPVNEMKQMQWSDWVKIDEGFEVDSKVYHHHASVILPNNDVTPAVTDLIVSLVKESHTLPGDPGQCSILWDHIGQATTKVKSDDTAFFWRDGFYVMTILVQWLDPAQNQKYLDFADKCKNSFLPFAIQGKAAYLNYIDSTVQNWQDAYYGSNYARLQKIKDHWDPTNFFHFDQSIELTGTTNNGKAPAQRAIGTVNTGIVLPPEVSTKTEGVSMDVCGDGHSNRTKQTKARWDAYSMPDPTVLHGVTSHKEIYKIDGMERIKVLRGF
ncbi:hypothetical protein D9613_001013 [Agrocybe pediades]|uniref:FAD-binding PCMH-type domain-containing protein n=1 Tax=Agrocybe pediades TaxID=84607 RepID=A0A8H4R2S2_9AGAR|nr:hypothetical protein D9613_001013 [Agrocybe pediades]